MANTNTHNGLSDHAVENISQPNNLAPLIKALSNPWSKTNLDGVVILGIAENYLVHDEVAAHIKNNFSVEAEPHLTYSLGPQGSPRLRNAIASFFNDRFHPLARTTANDFVITSGVTGMVDHLTWCICNEGEGLLLPQPLYTGFASDITTRSRGRLVPVSFEREDGQLDLDDVFDHAANTRCLERALSKAMKEGIKLKGVIITNPHNPLGKCYPPETIRAIASFCARNKLHYISDEIYALSVFSNPAYPNATPFHSVLSQDLDSVIKPEYIHVLYGAAKDFCANGLKLGAFFTRNDALRQAMIGITGFAWEAYIVQDMWAKMLEDNAFLDWYIPENQSRIAKSYGIVTSFLEQHDVPHYKGGNAGIYVWIDLRKYLLAGTELSKHARSLRPGSPDYEEYKPRETAMAEAWLENGVMFANGSSFFSEELGWFRVVFTHHEQALRTGLQRFINVL